MHFFDKNALITAQAVGSIPLYLFRYNVIGYNAKTPIGVKRQARGVKSVGASCQARSVAASPWELRVKSVVAGSVAAG